MLNVGKVFLFVLRNSYILVLSNYFSFKVYCVDEGEIMSTIEQKAVKRWYDNLGFGVGIGVTYCDGLKILPTLGIYYHLF